MKIDLDLVTENKKEVANLEEFVGLLINGKAPEAAIAEVWPRARVKQYVSDVNGDLIGWVICGGCDKHVSRCRCQDGPTEPKFFEKLREDDARRKAVAAGEHPDVVRTAVRSGAKTSGPRSDQASSTSGPTEEEPSASPSTATSGAAAPAVSPSPGPNSPSLVPCKIGEHLVSVDTAERNDDGSWTCFEHQSAAATRGGTDGE